MITTTTSNAVAHQTDIHRDVFNSTSPRDLGDRGLVIMPNSSATVESTRSHATPISIPYSSFPAAYPFGSTTPPTPSSPVMEAESSTSQRMAVTSDVGPRKRLKTRHIPISPAYHSMVAGAGAGLVSSVVTCPLDVIKTRLQAQISATGKLGYEGVGATVVRIFGHSGIKGFYRGLGPTIMGYLPTWGIYFSVYDAVKDRLRGASEDGEEGWGTHLVAAMSAGATGTIVTNPLWVIKTRFMAQAVQEPDQVKYRHTIDAVRTIYRQEGLKAFYKGLAPSLMGVSHVAVQFPLYEQLKVWAAPEDHTPLHSQTILLCSATSKMVASLATYPHEVLRTRLQIARTHSAQSGAGAGTASSVAMSKGLIETLKGILNQDGWRGLYRGLSINLIRTVPNSAVTMLTYELIMRRLTV